MCRSMYPFMRVLRLADRKIPGMDKLLFYTLQADRVVPKYLKAAEAFGKTFLTNEVVEVLESTTDLASVSFEESDYDEGVGLEKEEEDEEEGEEEDEVELEEFDSDDDECGDESSDDDMDADTEKEDWSGSSLAARVMTLWQPRKKKVSHPYSQVGLMLSPIPSIMEFASARGVTPDMQEVSVNVCQCHFRTTHSPNPFCFRQQNI